MSKRKVGRTSLPEVEEKKAKPGSPSDKSTEEKPHEPAIETPEVITSIPDVRDYIQIIVTGPRKCGKSCLALSYMGQLFPPRRGEFLSKQYLRILEGGQPVMIWDLDSRNQFRGYRQKSYPEADIVLLCFDVRKPENVMEGNRKRGNKNEDLEKLLRPWYTELQDCYEGVKIFLVGLKGDLKVHSEGDFFSEEERIHAISKFSNIEPSYKEVSAHCDKNGVNELFKMAIESINRPKPKRMFSNCGFEIVSRKI